MNENQINRREFLRDLGMLGAGVLAATSPWLKTFADVNETAKERVKLGMIGPGSRGQFLLGFLSQNPKADIVAFADPYQPSIDAALSIVPTAKVYHDYKRLLEDKAIEAVVVATPLATHYQIVMDAFDAGKHVYCEKTIGYTMEQRFNMYQKHLETGRLFFTGQQRLFDPRYIKAMEMVHQGIFGEITAVHAFWNRNGDWRRDVPQKDKNSSKGLMTELACHQLQVGTWAFGKLPQKVMGHGAITYWKDGREVYDNINTIYVFDDGKKLTWGSDIANKFYGLEEQILGSKGTVEPERGRYYFEDTDLAPAPAFLQMLNDWDAKLFGAKAFAGTSWAAETGSTNRGELILGKEPDNDGTSLLTEAFVEACITGKQPDRIAEEGYYASLLCLWGHEALEREEIINFPTEYQIDYDVYGTKKQSPNI